MQEKLEKIKNQNKKDIIDSKSFKYLTINLLVLWQLDPIMLSLFAQERFM